MDNLVSFEKHKRLREIEKQVPVLQKQLRKREHVVLRLWHRVLLRFLLCKGISAPFIFTILSAAGCYSAASDGEIYTTLIFGVFAVTFFLQTLLGLLGTLVAHEFGIDEDFPPDAA